MVGVMFVFTVLVNLMNEVMRKTELDKIVFMMCLTSKVLDSYITCPSPTNSQWSFGLIFMLHSHNTTILL